MNLKSNKAITLVALIITIIILLILAGVSLSMILGENGLINKAQSSVNAYQQAALNEQNLLQSIEDYMGNYGLPDNTPTTPAGTHVKPPAKWLGTIVDAVADGKGNTFPVPKSFYYVGGDYTNGVIISDDPADAYDGTIDKTTWEYTTNLVGNQFVWIPCTEDEYHKTDWGSGNVYGTTYDHDSAYQGEIVQIAKYDGFYVGRYEAGLADTITEYTGNQIATSSIYNVTGIPKSKAGELPWIFINYSNSKKNAEKMYKNNDYVISGLTTGTQWDVMLNRIIGTINENKMVITKNDILNSTNWGNYENSSIKYTGRKSNIFLSSGTWYMAPFGNYEIDGKTTLNARNELTTGASKVTEAYHIYDIAGNVWEWTEETGEATGYHVMRGGCCINTPSEGSACHRHVKYAETNTNYALGFRVVLYIK